MALPGTATRPRRIRSTNLSPTKRSFEETVHIHLDTSSSYTKTDTHYVGTVEYPTSTNLVPCSPSKRRSSSYPLYRPYVMPTDRDLIMSDSFPSFMSVYGSEESTIYNHIQTETEGDPKAEQHVTLLTLAHKASPQHQPPKQIAHRNSVHSLFTESTESSPTTTDSTFDSPLVSDNSASCSPESATDSIPPLSAFQRKKMSQEPQPTSAVIASEHLQQISSGSSPVSLVDTTKNVKKLTLDMNLTADRRQSTVNPVDLASHTLSAPTSPLKEPIRSARKKPTNLSIRTPASAQLTFPNTPGRVPPTPGHRPMLHQFPSSPALLTLASPRGPPSGGMFLPLPKLSMHMKNNSSSSNGSLSLSNNNLPDLREEEDAQLPKSGEAPERGYMDGPIQIYDSGVYLYLEPTALEASGFDTVINVAKEVKNPFKEQEAGKQTVMSVWREQTPRDRRSMAEPPTAISEFSFKTANEWPMPEPQATPTTPTQSTYERKPKEPEYLHVGWDHNSEILEDLYPLCQLIDDRTQEGKKVLIHCQLGVSRSASLIIAYGLFKGYQPDFHTMYMTVKDRSRWVGPNMSLIYQLTDFKSRISSGSYIHKAKELDPSWFSRPQDVPRQSNSAPASAVINKDTASLLVADPLRARQEISAKASPRPTPLRLNKALPPVPPFPVQEKESTLADKPLPIVTDTPNHSEEPSQKTPTAVKRAASRPLPFRERNMDLHIPEHNLRVTPGSTLSQSSSSMDLAARDVPELPSLFSPRAAEFATTPWGIKGAGDLMSPASRVSSELPTGFSWLPAHKDVHGHHRTASRDPRAPMQAQETRGVFRSIEDYL